MYQPIPLQITIPSVRNSLRRSSRDCGRRAFLLIPLALAWLTLAPAARAVIPAPDGGYPNANTAEGTNALLSLTTGSNNTAIGFEALFSNTTGCHNTANG